MHILIRLLGMALILALAILLSAGRAAIRLRGWRCIRAASRIVGLVLYVPAGRPAAPH